MTDLEQALAIGGGIFVVVMASQYGRRDYSWHKKVYPLVSLAIFGYFYLKDAPTATVDFTVYGVGVLIGLAFAVAATRATGTERDSEGTVHTTCGKGFAAVWLGAVLLRVGFIVAVDHVGWFRQDVGEFLGRHRIAVGAIPPFFVLMAIVMVVGRIAMVEYRVTRLGVPVTAPAPAVAA